MNESDRMQILHKMEELQTRVGAFVVAAKLIEQELVRLQATFYQRTQEVPAYDQTGI